MQIKKGDLVACYISNTDQWQLLMSWGIVLEVDFTLGDILVLDNEGSQMWWPQKRWKTICSKNKIKKLDIDVKLA